MYEPADGEVDSVTPTSRTHSVGSHPRMAIMLQGDGREFSAL